MTMFLLASAFLVLTALAVVTWPLWRRHGVGTPLHRNVDVMGRQLRQLKELHASGALTDEQFTASRVALERRLIDALVPAGHKSPDNPGAAPNSRRLALTLAAFMLVVTIGGYQLVGSPRHLEIGPGHAEAGSAMAGAAADGSTPAAHELTAQQIGEMAEKLAARLQAQPDDAAGWAMLARSRVALGQHDKAVEAFSRAQRLLPRDADLLADYADALAMAHGKSLEGQPAVLLQRALAVDPHHAKALALAGTAAFDRKDYTQAVRYWETLAQTEPADGPFAGQVDDGIAEARRLAGLPPVAAGERRSTPRAAETPAAATIAGTVTLAPALRDKVSPDDVLFVFARAVEGARMPVAISRRRVRDLPLDFMLDDSMAMSPESRLSGVKRVVVGARISRSGNAMPQIGDFEGTTPAVDVGTAGLRLEINQAVQR